MEALASSSEFDTIEVDEDVAVQYLGLQESGIAEAKDIMKIETIDRETEEILRTITDRRIIDHRCTRKTSCPVCLASLRNDIEEAPRSVRTIPLSSYGR